MGDDDASYTVKYLDGEEEEVTWIARAGRARVTYSNGDVYEGDFSADGKKHGQGQYTWAAPETEDEDDAGDGAAAARVYNG